VKDKVLAELVAAAEGGDGVALTMLADRIADADPEDRIECLKAWCGAASRARRAERELATPRPVPAVASRTFELSGGETWRASMDVPSRDNEGYARMARESLRDRACDALTEQVQDGQWYAVRITTRQLPRPHPMANGEIECEMRVVPMGGGAGARQAVARFAG
jgi:hypothetical protein